MTVPGACPWTRQRSRHKGFSHMKQGMDSWKNSPFCLPHGYLDSQIAVDGDGQQRQDWTLSEDEHRAGDQQAAVKVRLESDADGYGEGNDERPDRNVSQGQGDDETKRGVSQRAVNTHSPDHHHVPDDRRHGDHHLHPDVEGFRGRQTRSHVQGCWRSARSAEKTAPQHVEGVPCWSLLAPTETARLGVRMFYVPTEVEVVSDALYYFRISSGTSSCAPDAWLGLHTVPRRWFWEWSGPCSFALAEGQDRPEYWMSHEQVPKARQACVKGRQNK